jgi:hypothetical protein
MVHLVALVACILLAAGVMPKAARAEALTGGCAPPHRVGERKRRPR